MSYSVEEVTKIVQVDKNVGPSGVETYPYKLIEYLDKFSEQFKKTNTGDIRLNDLAFSIEHKLDDHFTLKYKKVKSGGPIVGFMGYYLDLSNGYVLLDVEKSNNYIPMINYYNWLEKEHDIHVSPRIMMALIERYKVGDIDEDDFMEELMGSQTSSNSEGSSIGRLLLDDYVGDKSKFFDVSFVDIVYRFFTDISSVVGGLSGKFGATNQNTKLYVYKEFQKFGADIIEFIRSFDKNVTMSTNISSALLNYDVLAKETRRNLAFRGLSAMVSTGNNAADRVVNPSEIVHMLNSEVTAMNIRDIAEERKDDSLVDFDNLALEVKAVSTEEAQAVIDKVGASEYLNKTMTTKAMSDLNLPMYIRKVTSTIDLEREGRDFGPSTTLPDVVSGFRRMARVFKSSIDMVDSVMR